MFQLHTIIILLITLSLLILTTNAGSCKKELGSPRTRNNPDKIVKRKREDEIPKNNSSTFIYNHEIEEKHSDLVLKTNKENKEFFQQRSNRSKQFIEHEISIPFGSHNREELKKHFNNHKEKSELSNHQKIISHALLTKNFQLQLSLSDFSNKSQKQKQKNLIRKEIAKNKQVSKILINQSKQNQKLAQSAEHSFENSMQKSIYSKKHIERQWKEELNLRYGEEQKGRKIYQPLNKFEREHKENLDQKLRPSKK